MASAQPIGEPDFIRIPRALAASLAAALEAMPETDDEAEPAVDPSAAVAAARRAVQARRRRARMFPALAPGEPGWDILLDLYIARHEHRAVGLSGLCLAAGVPALAALRSIGEMEQDGMLVRTIDPDNARGLHIALSDEAVRSMDRYFAG